LKRQLLVELRRRAAVFARDLRLRVISSSNNGIWIFIERDSVGDRR
jgi:hypothetical protein